MVSFWRARLGRPARRRAGRAGGAPSRASNPSAGYNLVVLAVMITVLNIVIAKALPLWSTVIQRQKEEELIFRGLQYAEAIRVFESRHKRLPNRLEELVEVEPRSIRQLWKNPMTEDGGWQLIPAGTGRQLGGRNQDPNQDRNRNRNRNRSQDQNQGRQALPGDPSRPDKSLRWVPGGEAKIGSFPISGVSSPEGGDAIKVFAANPNAPGGGGSDQISDWQFTVDLAKSLVKPINPQNPIAPSMNAADLGKPWPPGIQPLNVPAPQGPGGQQGPGTQQGPRRGSPGIHPVVPGQGAPGRQPPGQKPGGRGGG